MQPTTLDDICAVVGYTSTRILLAWYEGRWLYVPTTASPTHPLVRLIGLSALRALVAEFSGERLRLPVESRDLNMRRNREIAEALCSGVSEAKIAQKHGLTIRRVGQLRAELARAGWIDWASPGQHRRSRHRPRPVIVPEKSERAASRATPPA